MPELLIPGSAVPGAQNLGVHQGMRLGTCEEFGCEWWRDGREGVDGAKPFKHPQGVSCGDYSRCKPCAHPPAVNELCGWCEPCKAGTSNCPCPSRLARSKTNPAVRGHLVPNILQIHARHLPERRDLTFHKGKAAEPFLVTNPTHPLRGLRFAHLPGSAVRLNEEEFVDRLQEGTGTFVEIQKHGL